jgi:glutathione S-transferase
VRAGKRAAVDLHMDFESKLESILSWGSFLAGNAVSIADITIVAWLWLTEAAEFR